MIGRRIVRAARAALRELRTDRIASNDPGVDVDYDPDAHRPGMPDYATRERGWMQTVTGRRFYPLEPRAKDIDVYDIAHGLAMCCRYAGHTKRFYSVAEHCVHVSREVERHLTERVDGRPKVTNLTILRWALLALLHDSAEAYLGDMIRPLKHQPEMSEFRLAEARIELEVRRALYWPVADVSENLDGSIKLIKEIDDRIIVDEIAILKVDTTMYDIAAAPLGVRIECWAPEHARARFLHRFEGLVKAIAVEDVNLD